MFRFLLIIVSVTSVLLGYVWSRHLYHQKQTELIELTNESRQLEQQIYQLRLKLAKLKRPARLDHLAKERWKLQVPTANQIIILEDPLAK